MKKRLVPSHYIEKAYKKEDNINDMDFTMENTSKGMDKLPKEMFEILGDIVSFIEIINKTEGENHENK